jgi:hypothetical protein
MQVAIRIFATDLIPKLLGFDKVFELGAGSH